MNRKLRTLGLALFAVLAVSATSASAAWGANFHSDGSPTTVTPAGNNTQVFQTTVDEFTCTTVGGSGTNTGTTTSEVTFKPTYSGCKGVNKGLNAHVDMMSCAYIITANLVGSHAPVHVECSVAGDEITIQATIGGVKVPCLDIPAQTPTGGGLTYDNGTLSGVEDITATATITGITYTETGVCGSGETNNGSYTGQVTVTGENAEGEDTDIWWE